MEEAYLSHQLCRTAWPLFCKIYKPGQIKKYIYFTDRYQKRKLIQTSSRNPIGQLCFSKNVLALSTFGGLFSDLIICSFNFGGQFLTSLISVGGSSFDCLLLGQFVVVPIRAEEDFLLFLSPMLCKSLDFSFPSKFPGRETITVAIGISVISSSSMYLEFIIFRSVHNLKY